jgi:hypothetical protein
MNNLTSYYLYEIATTSVSSFLKAQYNNIFKEPDQALNNLFSTFTKRIDKEKNVANLYERFLRSNQTTVTNEINNAETIDAVNKIMTDNIKYFYFSLKPVVNKLQNDEFTMEEIFSKSRDKRLQTLMSYPEDQFANAVQQYVNDGVLPWVKKDAKLDQTDKEKQQTQQPAANQPNATTERIKYNISKILEADDPNQQAKADEDLVAYKKSAIKWLNLSLFDLLKPKMQLIRQLDANTSNVVDQLARQMKGTPNDNAKKMIINKIMGMNKEELQKLADSIGIGKEELGQL